MHVSLSTYILAICVVGSLVIKYRWEIAAFFCDNIEPRSLDDHEAHIDKEQEIEYVKIRSGLKTCKTGAEVLAMGMLIERFQGRYSNVIALQQANDLVALYKKKGTELITSVDDSTSTIKVA